MGSTSKIISLCAKCHVEQIVSLIIQVSERTKKEVSIFFLSPAQKIIIGFSQPEYLTSLSHLYALSENYNCKISSFQVVIIYSNKSQYHRKVW